MLKTLGLVALILVAVQARAIAQIGLPAPTTKPSSIGMPSSSPPPSIGLPPADSTTHIGLPPTSRPTHVAEIPFSIPGVNNFARISPALYRGEQPTADGFVELKKLGIKTVVCLRTAHDDETLLKGTGLQYVSIPCRAWHPEDEDLVAFLKVLENPANQPVFLHCMQGRDRTGYMIAGYRMVNEGWTSTEAIAEMRNFEFNEVWRGIPAYLKQLNPDSIRSQLEKAKAMKVQTMN